MRNGLLRTNYTSVAHTRAIVRRDRNFLPAGGAGFNSPTLDGRSARIMAVQDPPDGLASEMLLREVRPREGRSGSPWSGTARLAAAACDAAIRDDRTNRAGTRGCARPAHG